MYLTAPTIEELKESDLTDLVDMLSRQAGEYSRLIKSEGTTSKAIAMRELIVNIQTVIETKKNPEKRATAK